jgi:hypothetical protein
LCNIAYPFIVFINDILSLTDNPVHAFADDCTLHCSFQGTKTTNIVTARETAASSINNDLNRIADWGETNRVSFNALKTQLILISNRKQISHPQIYMEGAPIKFLSDIFCLGIKIDQVLSFSSHITSMVKSISRKLNILHRARSYFNHKQIINLYKAFIVPCLEYCCHLWDGSGKVNMGKLGSVQRKAIKMIDCPHLTDNLHSLAHRRAVASFSLFFRYSSGRCSIELRDMIKTSIHSGHCTRSTTLLNPNQVFVEQCRVNSFKKSFLPG